MPAKAFEAQAPPLFFPIQITLARVAPFLLP
jgi:hypothetical protein